MNFVPLPDPRLQTIETLSAQIDSYFAAGGTARQVESGVFREKGPAAMETRAQKLRAGRDKLAGPVRELAAQGVTIEKIAQQFKTSHTRIRLIGSENGIKFGADR